MISIRLAFEKWLSSRPSRENARTMAGLLSLRFVNLALAYVLIIIISKLFSSAEYILFEKITFFLMLGNILLAPILISMWHGNIEHLITEGFVFLVALSILASVLLLVFTKAIVLIVAAGAMIYYFCYYLKATLYTHLITGKNYYVAYGCNTLFYVVYIIGVTTFASGAFVQSHLLSFLLFPSAILIAIFLYKWKSLLNNSHVTRGAPKNFGELYSIPLLLHNIMILLIASGERLVLESYAHIETEMLAAFLYLTTIVSAFQSLGISLAEWLRPQVFERLERDLPVTRLYNTAVTILMVMFLVFLSAGWPILLMVSTDKVQYFSFFPYFSVLAVTQLMLVLAFFIDLQIVYRKKYALLLLASAVGLLAKFSGYVVWNGLGNLEGIVFANIFGASVFLISTSLFVYYLRKN